VIPSTIVGIVATTALPTGSIDNAALTHCQHCRDDSIASRQHRRTGIVSVTALPPGSIGKPALSQ